MDFRESENVEVAKALGLRGNKFHNIETVNHFKRNDQWLAAWRTHTHNKSDQWKIS